MNDKLDKEYWLSPEGLSLVQGLATPLSMKNIFCIRSHIFLVLWSAVRKKVAIFLYRTDISETLIITGLGNGVTQIEFVEKDNHI